MKEKTSPPFRVLISDETENFTKEVHLKQEDDITFQFLRMTLKIGLRLVSVCKFSYTIDW